MFFIKKKRVICPASVVIEAIQEAIDVSATSFDLRFTYCNQIHRIGYSSSFRGLKGTFERVFYVDTMKYRSLDGFKENAKLEGKLIELLPDKLEILKVDNMHPKYYRIFHNYIVSD